jgi:glycerol-3-phosphate acyltransferase PlsY
VDERIRTARNIGGKCEFVNEILGRLTCFLIGAACGSFLTAEAVARKTAGKSSFEIGTGNPGMANIMAQLGFVPGIIVLAGDLGKTIAACLISYLLFSKAIGPISLFYAGLGATVGHCFPAWHRFRGGKGVSCCCMALFLISPLWGLLADVLGMLVVFFTQYLCLGGAAIPMFFIPPAFVIYGPEGGVLAIILAALCFYEHWPAIRTIPSGNCPKNDVWGKIREGISSLREKRSPENR